METLAIVILYMFVILIYTYYTRLYLRKNRFPGAYNGFIMGCLLYYGFIPFIFIIFKGFYLNQAGDWRYSQILQFIYGPNVKFENILLTIGGLLVGLVGSNFGYKIKRRFNNVANNEYISTALDDGFISVIRRTAYVTLVLGGFAIVLYVSAFGGLNRALQLAEVLRQHYSSMSDYGMSGIYSYFLILSGALTVTPLLFYLAWKNSHKTADLIWSLFAFVLAAVYLLINSGKSAILRLGIIIFYMILHERKVKRKWFWFALVIMLGLPIMDILDALFAQQSISEAFKNFNYLYLAREFAIPTELNYNMNEIVQRYGYLYFKNLVTDFLDILPGLQFEASFTNTSEFMRGVNWMRLGGTPNDVLTYGFLQFRYIGVFVIWLLWGMISGWLDNMIGRINNERGRRMISIIVCMNMFSVITCADISSTILYNLSFILIALVLWRYNKRAVRIQNN